MEDITMFWFWTSLSDNSSSHPSIPYPSLPYLYNLSRLIQWFYLSVCFYLSLLHSIRTKPVEHVFILGNIVTGWNLLPLNNSVTSNKQNNHSLQTFIYFTYISRSLSSKSVLNPERSVTLDPVRSTFCLPQGCRLVLTVGGPFSPVTASLRWPR